jgi:hypothetical protein
MVEFGLFRRRTFLGAVLAMIGYGASAQVMIFFLPLYLENAYGFEPLGIADMNIKKAHPHLNRSVKADCVTIAISGPNLPPMAPEYGPRWHNRIHRRGRMIGLFWPQHLHQTSQLFQKC